MALEVQLIALLQDNYAYLLRDTESGTVGVVDPSEASPVKETLARLQWPLHYILNTHHHPDHCGGNLELVAATGAKVVGPRADAERIPGLVIEVGEEAPFRFGKLEARVLDIPGHTRGHIAYWFFSERALFCGDTLFAMGCGRLFEGTPAQMWQSLGKLARLPGDTRVYCGHEYTEANAAFAVTVDPRNAALVERQARVKAKRARGEPTIPSLMEEEVATNPFLRADDEAIRRGLRLETSGPVKVFAEIRRRKDEFRFQKE